MRRSKNTMTEKGINKIVIGENTNSKYEIDRLCYKGLLKCILPILVLIISFGNANTYAQGSSVSKCSFTPKPDESDFVKTLLELHHKDPKNVIVIYTLARQMGQQNRVDEALNWLLCLENSKWDDFLEDNDFKNITSNETYLKISERFAKRARVVKNAEVALELYLPDLAPEGTAWDPLRNEILLSSAYQRKVIGVNNNGEIREVVTKAQDGLLAVLGMEVDKQDHLWVASTAAPFMQDFSSDQAGKASVYVFDLASGKTIGNWESDQNPALFNDLTVSPDGSVFVTDTLNGRVLKLDTETGSWTPIGIEIDFIGPNGLALSGSSANLFVADFLGLTRIDLTTGKAERLSIRRGTENLGGIDGLSYKSGFLIAIQNLIGRGRVWKIKLDRNEQYLENAELLEVGNPLFRNPTTGVVSNNDFFFLANPMLQLPSKKGLEPFPEGESLRLLRISLDGEIKQIPNAQKVGSEHDTEKINFSNKSLKELKNRSDEWWTLWLPPQSADLDLAAKLEGNAAGFGYFGENLRSIEDVEDWKKVMRKWLDTLEHLEFYPIDRKFKIIGNTGLEWGHYYERQVKKGGEVKRNHRGRYTLTWVKSAEGWHMVSYHRSAAQKRN